MVRLVKSIKRQFRYLTNAKTTTINGVRLVSDRDRVPPYLRDLMFREIYENTERNVLLKILRPGSRVVEIGAGIGFIALLAAKICGQGNVWTYEANALVEDLIQDNFRLNDLTPELTMRAVTIDGREMSFNAAENIISSSAFDRDTTTKRITVRSDRIADLLLKHHPDVLIMDVEGGEYELLLGTDLLGVTDILVELHPHIIGADKVAEIVSSLGSRGFQPKTSDRKTFHFSRA